MKNQESVFTPKQPSTNIETNMRKHPSTGTNSKIKCIGESNNSLQITDTTPTARNKNAADFERRVLMCTKPVLVRVEGQ